MTLNRRTLLAGAIASADVPLLAACGGGDEDHGPGTLAEVAKANGFTALVAAADKAGLVPALSSSSSSLTVFAPTDAAFTSLATTLGFADATAMVTALEGDTLASILQYHVLPSKKLAADLVAGGATQNTLYTFEGTATSLTLDTSAGVKITDEVLTQATVTAADVPASNGVIHVIDKVLVPPGVLNIVQMAKLNSNFSTLVAAVSATSDLGGVLSGADKYTVFAPVNEAFAALPEGALTTLLETPDDKLRDILLFHVLPGDVRAADVAALEKPATVATALPSESITITSALKIRETFLDGSASLVATDVVASNGVIHVIDRVLNPDYVDPVQPV